MRLYHGTSIRNAAAIRRGGLAAGTFVATDREWAERYAARAVRWDGIPDNRTGLIVALDAEPDELRRDPDDDEREHGWLILRRRRPALALHPVRVKLPPRFRERGTITATSPVLPEWVGFA